MPNPSKGQTAKADIVPLAEILVAFRHELADLERLAWNLQQSIAPPDIMLLFDAPAIEGLQALDLLTQRLDGLGAFLEGLTPTLSPAAFGGPAQAAKHVRLADLAARLAQPSDIGALMIAESSGDFELFAE